MEVLIESRKMVGPRAIMPGHLRRYTISSIDQLQATGYVGLLLIYHPVNASAFDCGSVRLLEESLSEALTIYYPLAGRYVEDGVTSIAGDRGSS
ncbi:hypothetical protein MLD38_037272 [Melastoma candidum]|uniref:Uncharacterized protein n=1 Tax=Melastoma candidum TaxID=119954 RepID=A0ACB9LM85_9MYRT|nr:hypothetical protein MLD38_037272 [Melastoma candidum]